jgi:hypothetical protein
MSFLYSVLKIQIGISSSMMLFSMLLIPKVTGDKTSILRQCYKQMVCFKCRLSTLYVKLRFSHFLPQFGSLMWILNVKPSIQLVRFAKAKAKRALDENQSFPFPGIIT